MKKNHIVRYSFKDIQKMKLKDTGTDWKRVNSMSEAEIEANARSDPDNPPLTKKELSRAQWMPSPKAIRKKLDMTQREFAQAFHFSLGAVRDWEQGRGIPDPSTRALLRVIAYRPDIVRTALNRP